MTIWHCDPCGKGMLSTSRKTLLDPKNADTVILQKWCEVGHDPTAAIKSKCSVPLNHEHVPSHRLEPTKLEPLSAQVIVSDRFLFG